PEIDLGRTSRLEPDDAVAFKVTVTDQAGRPRSDFNAANQRWRGLVLDRYDETRGRWSCGMMYPGGQPLLKTSLMPPGLDVRQLHFEVPRKTGCLFLAEPLQLGAAPGEMPVQVFDRRNGPVSAVPVFFEAGGTAIPFNALFRSEYHYVQTVAL